ncbi:Gfo/Idh/MocA family oxidoreductase [Prolixibacter denitrificans]|uniref:Oxidoreductase family protein n=1 Tax=Prolixibacter denitrificans TaxID=1541063 RepID=A0A2P8C8Q6_9BACT|nr:Gfo/Idh/MocA family oxidoreductase [Prolixibacter denitrificans]PSK81338.1 oxidoreductase family protein [Prolixibacter denitrificans]GET21577.1 hypothetical protein JCM18694_18230 [Prolixibacter denitrificans]
MVNCYNIAIIGSGQLGSRHLQSIKQIDLQTRIYVLDKNEESLAVAKERYEQIPPNTKVKSILFTQNIENLPTKIDLAIIATNSKNRATLLNNIVSIREINNLIIEKVLFQTKEEYSETKDLFDLHKINAWVNCPRRVYPIYQMLNNLLKDNTSSLLGIIDGSNWGLGSNSIHYIDIFSKLTNCSEYTTNTKLLDPKILQSKRDGYIEFSGTLNLNFKNKSHLTINSRKDLGVDTVFYLTNGYSQFIINESRKKLTWTSEKNNNLWETLDFEIPFQSQLTSMIAYEILTNNTCELTTFEDSVQLHLPLINGFIEFLRHNIDKSYKHCPIT